MSVFNKEKNINKESLDLEKNSIADLASENRKKRKEIIKPWGKKERLFVFFVLVLTVLLSGTLALNARSWKLPRLERIALPLWGEERIIIEPDNPQTQKAKKASEAFRSYVFDRAGVWSLYVIRLEDGTSYGVSENEIFEAASFMKLPIMVTLYKEGERGNLKLDTKYVLKEEDKMGGSGSLAYKEVGTEFTLRELARYMGKQSDNTAQKIIRSILGDSLIKKEIAEIGMKYTSLDENKTTPKDIGILFEKLYNGRILEEEARDEILEFLTDTIYENWIRKGIPEEIEVVHKYGRERGVVNDAGIVFSDEPFVLVLMTKGVIEKDADFSIPEITKIIYQIETQSF